MKVCYKLLLGLVLVMGVLVSGCVEQSIVDFGDIPPEKYCENDDDCLTSCGTVVGPGSCYNKEYVQKFNFSDPTNNSIDETCCECDYFEPHSCFCMNNYCTINENYN